VASASLRQLPLALEVVAPAFSRPGFFRALVVAVGWVRCQGRHTITSALVTAGVAARYHWAAFHRFFSRMQWAPDEVGRLLLLALLGLALGAGGVLVLLLDDTLAPKRGGHIFALGSHRDAVLSSARHKVLRFGHVWVVLAVLVQLPGASRPFALPICLRLYRSQKECRRHGAAFRTKTQLAAEMLQVVHGWLRGRSDVHVRVVMDGGYACDTVFKALPAGFVGLGAMRPDAALTGAPPKRRAHQKGRSRVRGAPLPPPKAMAASGRWKRVRAHLYGRHEDVDVQSARAQWYRVAGATLCRVVVVRCTRGTRAFRTFFCTDPHLDVREVLETYGLRWCIEVTFRDLKQHLGFADSPARSPGAVRRTAPFVAFLYSLLVLDFARRARAGLTAARALLPVRPWYPGKHHVCFEDILRAGRAGLEGLDVLDPALRKPARQKTRRPSPASSATPLAAAD
jgi:hypothetical protein